MPAELFSLILETHSNKQTLMRNTNLSQCANHPCIYIYQTKIYTFQRFSTSGPPIVSPSCRRGEVAHVGTWCKATPENHHSLTFPLLAAILLYGFLETTAIFFTKKMLLKLIFQKDPIILPHCLLLHEYHTHLHIGMQAHRDSNCERWFMTFISTIHLHELFITVTLHPTLQKFREINTTGINRHQLRVIMENQRHMKQGHQFVHYLRCCGLSLATL